MQSLEALASIERSRESPSQQLLAAAEVLGVDLSQLKAALEADPNYTPLPRQHAFREQRVLKWLLKKLITPKNLANGSPDFNKERQEFVLEQRTWLLFFHVVSVTPRDVLQEILLERHFFEHTTLHAEILLTQPLSTLSDATTSHEPTHSDNDDRPTKKRKLSSTSQTSQILETASVENQSILLVYLRSISKCTSALAATPDDNRPDPTSITLAWTSSPHEAARLTGQLLTIIHSLRTSSLQSKKECLLSTVVDVLRLWQSVSGSHKNVEQAEKGQAFNDHMLAPALLLLESFEHERKGGTKTAIKALERLLAVHTVLPFRATFTSKYASTWKQRRQVLCWQDIEPIFTQGQTQLAPCLSCYRDLTNTRGSSISIAVAMILDIAKRSVPRSNLRHKQKEQPWLDALFIALMYLSLPSMPRLNLEHGNYVTDGPLSTESDLTSAVEPLMRAALTGVLQHPQQRASSSIFSPSLETRAYSLWCVIVYSGDRPPPWQLVSNWISSDDEIMLSPMKFRSEEDARDRTILDSIKGWLLRKEPLDKDTFRLVRDQIAIPLVRLLIRNREFRQLVELWESQLVEATKTYGGLHYQTLSSPIVFEQAELFEEVENALRLQGLPEAGYQLLETVLNQVSSLNTATVEQQARWYANLTILETFFKALPEDFLQHRREMLSQLRDGIAEVATTSPDIAMQRWRVWKFLRTIIRISNASSSHLRQVSIPQRAEDCWILTRLAEGRHPKPTTEREAIARYTETFQHFALLVDLGKPPQNNQTLNEETKALITLANDLGANYDYKGLGADHITTREDLIYCSLAYVCSYADVLRSCNQIEEMAVSLTQFIVKPMSSSPVVVLRLLEVLLTSEACISDGALFRSCLDAAGFEPHNPLHSQPAGTVVVGSSIAKILPLQSLKRAFTKDIGKNHFEALRRIGQPTTSDHDDNTRHPIPSQSSNECKNSLLALVAPSAPIRDFRRNRDVQQYTDEVRGLVAGLSNKHLADLLKLLREEPGDAQHVSKTLLVATIVSKSGKIDLHDETALADELVMFVTGHTARQTHSPVQLLIHLDCWQEALENHAGLVNQFAVDSILESIALIASSQFSAKGFDSSDEQNPPASAIYDRLCAIVGSTLNRHRLRLSDRFHLLLATLQSLLRCLFYSNTDQARLAQNPAQAASRQTFLKALPPWLKASAPLPPSSAQNFTRLLSSICNPTVSAARSSRSRSKSFTKPKTTADLNDETQKAKRTAGQHMQYLVMEYCKCTLDGQVGTDVKEKLLPGLYSVLDAMSRDLMRAMNAQMDPSSRAIFKGLYDDWVRYGRWDHS